MSSRPSVGPTQPSIQRVPGAFIPGVKRQGREAERNVDVYIHSPLRLQGVVLA
jgi:hypothetical protein